MNRCVLRVRGISLGGQKVDRQMGNTSSELKGKTFSKQRAYSWTKPKVRTVQEEFV